MPKNLDRAIRELEKITSASSAFDSISEKWDYSETKDIPEALAKELDEEDILIDHLGDKHVYPILRWKIEVGLEKKPESRPGIFINYGADFQNPTIEEYEYCRLLKKHHEAIGYDFAKDPNYKF